MGRIDRSIATACGLIAGFLAMLGGLLSLIELVAV